MVYVFIHVCLFVCLFVCLSVNNFTQKLLLRKVRSALLDIVCISLHVPVKNYRTDLHEIWCVASVCHNEETINFWWWSKSESGFWVRIRLVSLLVTSFIKKKLLDRFARNLVCSFGMMYRRNDCFWWWSKKDRDSAAGFFIRGWADGTGLHLYWVLFSFFFFSFFFT